MFKEYEDYIEQLELDKVPSTIDSYKRSLTDFINFFEIKDLESLKKIAVPDCKKYQLHLKKDTKLFFTSINARVMAIRVFFNYLVDADLLNKSPWEKVEDIAGEKKEQAFLTDEEVQSMVDKAVKDERLIFLLYIETGMRNAALRSLKLSDYDGTHITIKGKGYKHQKIILLPETREMLNEYIKVRNETYGDVYPNIFISQKGCPFCGQGIYDKIKALAKRAGIEEDRRKDIHVHTTRHTFATKLLETEDLATVQRAMGHATVRTTMNYIHIPNTDAAILNQKRYYKLPLTVTA
jgi:site-specific recombinase XerD